MAPENAERQPNRTDNPEEERAKRCAEVGCEKQFRTRNTADYAEIMQHYLDEHRESEALSNVLKGVRVEVTCQECQERFVSDLSGVYGRLGADAYCDECSETVRMGSIYAQELRPSQALSSAVDGELCPHNCVDTNSGESA